MFRAHNRSLLKCPTGIWRFQFELNKHYYDKTMASFSVMIFSEMGKKLPEYSIITKTPKIRFLWIKDQCYLGSLLDLFWTYNRATGKYLNIHACKSADNGRTWTKIWDTGVQGQPAPPVSLDDGSIAMVYVDRTSRPTIKMRLSFDKGKTWPDETEIVIYSSGINSQTQEKSTMQDAWAEMGKFSVGLPMTTLLPDGTVLVVFYAGAHTDFTDIRWARIGR